MRVLILGSGSRGNALVVESDGHRLLVDAGFSCRELERRMTAFGVDPATIAALVVTHEHGDHLRGADVFVRRYGVPLYATAGTLRAATRLSAKVRGLARSLASGIPVEVGDGFEVEPFMIPHDAEEPVGFVIQTQAGRRLGLAGDIGSKSRLAWGRLVDLDILVLETNHDLGMLRDGPYPWHLKQRVAGRHGHLSNREAAEGVHELVSDRLRHVALYHLSQTNNSPALALDVMGDALVACGCSAEIAVTRQDAPTPWLEVNP